MKTLALWALALCPLALAGCSSGDREAVATGPTPDEPLDGGRLVEGPLPPSSSGQLAYVGTDGNIYVLEPISGATVRVTDDGSSANTGAGIFHAGLVWSRSGELVFARTDTEAFRSSLYVVAPGRGEPTRVTAQSGILIYASFSPSVCEELACSLLATISDADGKPGGRVSFSVIDFETPAAPRAHFAEEGGQIYFAWAAEGELVRHRLDLQARSLDIVELAGGGVSRSIHGTLAPFFAPSYSLGRVVYALAGARGADPAVTVGDRAIALHVAPDTRRVAFAPSPDGSRLAFAVRGPEGVTPDSAFGPVQVVDLATGSVTRVGFPTVWAKAFYWSPDGRRLAYLSWLDTGADPAYQWRVFDVVTGIERGLAAFQPTPTFQTLTAFFDQFGQSHNVWSPDGRYLAYAAVDSGEEHVWLLDTVGKDGDRRVVADGVAAAFSWR
jgi:TolB protein